MIFKYEFRQHPKILRQLYAKNAMDTILPFMRSGEEKKLRG